MRWLQVRFELFLFPRCWRSSTGDRLVWLFEFFGVSVCVRLDVRLPRFTSSALFMKISNRVVLKTQMT